MKLLINLLFAEKLKNKKRFAKLKRREVKVALMEGKYLEMPLFKGFLFERINSSITR